MLGREARALPRRDVEAVGRQHLPRIAEALHAAVLEVEHAIAQLLHEDERVRHEENRLSAPRELRDRVEAAVRESLVAHREHLVHDENVRVDVHGHREAEPHVHSRGVRLHGLVDEVLEARERDDLGQLPLDLPAREPEHDAVDHDVLAPRDLRVEAGAELDEGRDFSVHREVPGRRLEEAGDELQERRLAAAVRPHDAERLAPRHRERDVREGGHDLGRSERRPEGAPEERRLQRAERARAPPLAIRLREARGGHGGRQTASGYESRNRSKSA